ncbi:MAG: hypothetical protein ABIG71_04840 [Candidatus Uhrbacteria bacterium]
MKRLTGTIQHHDLEGGIWRLNADDGETYDLNGNVPASMKSGHRVTVSGKVTDSMAGIGMGGGPMLLIGNIEKL